MHTVITLLPKSGLAFAECVGGAVITFDQALAARASHTVLLQ